jgi:hypothetical protein
MPQEDINKIMFNKQHWKYNECFKWLMEHHINPSKTEKEIEIDIQGSWFVFVINTRKLYKGLEERFEYRNTIKKIIYLL